MERFSESDCSACGLPVPVDLTPDGDLVRYADAQATVEALRAQLTALRELVGQWAWDTTNLLGDYRIATVADFNAEWTRRSIWLVEAVQATLPPPQAEQDQQTMYELRQQVEALQKKYDDLLGKYRQLVDFYDKHNGTPCEQIRHQQQVEALQRELESANALLHKKNCAIGKAETTIEALQRERDEAIREHGKESGFWGWSCARLLDKRDELQAALDAEREKVKGQSDERDRLAKCLSEMVKLVDDFMPNVGRCTIQNYQRLNDAPIEARQLLAALTVDETEDKAMNFPTLRTYSFSLPEGVVRLELPHPLSVASADELIQWLSIIERQVQRSPSPPPRRRNELPCQSSNDSVGDTTLKG